MPTVFEQIFGNGQGGAQGLLGNPAFMVGSGLLSNQANPWGGAIQGLAAAQGYKLSESKMKKDAENEARQAELQAMQMEQLKQAQERQKYTQALLASASSQNPALLQDPTFQSQLRQKAAAYGDPTALEQGGLLAPMPTAPKSTSLITNLQAMGIDPQSEQGRAIMMQSLTKPQTSINMGAQFPDLPKDHMWRDPANPGSGVVPIPGSPTDQAQRAAAGKAQTGAGNTLAKIDNVMGEIGRAMPEVGYTTSGLIGAMTKKLPGAPAKDLSGALTTIKANIGFAELQAMREASPTGGALGQVAVQELESLQSSIASLDQDQSPERLAANLQRVQQHYARWRAVVEQAKGGAAPQIVPGSSPAQNGDRVVDFNSLP